MARIKQPSNDRRITVLSGLWPRLQKLAEQDDISVADVVNAILLQSLRPYGIYVSLVSTPHALDADEARVERLPGE